MFAADVSDGHAVQGDGEVCVTAVEMMGRVTLRFDVQPGRRIAEPQLRTPEPPSAATNRGPHYATTAHGPDLFASAQQAALQNREEQLDLVEPRRVGRRKVKCYVVMLAEKRCHSFGFVCRKVVRDDVKLSSFRLIRHNLR